MNSILYRFGTGAHEGAGKAKWTQLHNRFRDEPKYIACKQRGLPINLYQMETMLNRRRGGPTKGNHSLFEYDVWIQCLN
jgi:hypothetical protein